MSIKRYEQRLYRREELIVEVTEVLSEEIEKSGITRSELARRTGKSKSFISQALGGGRNLTLRTVSDIADALGCRPRMRLIPREGEGKES